jgi:hypothetical protein
LFAVINFFIVSLLSKFASIALTLEPKKIFTQGSDEAMIYIGN